MIYRIKLMQRYKNSEALLERALKTIPLASQTFSKSKAQFPVGASPLFLEKGKGSKVWDVDGNEYIDFMNGLLCVSIGYADEDITNAVCQQIQNGVSFSLPHRLEMEVAEKLVTMIPCAEKVRFGKNGSDATSGAIRLARAYTKRDIVLVCGYHGWQDWYIGSTSRNLGVPKSTQDLTKVFKYNDLDSLTLLTEKYKGQIAAIIMEPMNLEYPKKGYLESVQKLAREEDIVFIFDETITGCRFAKGGAQEYFGVTPDLATFGKGLANGFPLSAIVGKAEIMDLMEDIFFSGTFGGETASLAAAKAVLEKVDTLDVPRAIATTGQYLLEKLDDLIKELDCENFLSSAGHPSWSFLVIANTADYSNFEIKTLFMQEMLKRGALTFGTHNISYSHSISDIDFLLSCYRQVFPILKACIESKNLLESLDCEPLVPLFNVR
jgi:glutamate-1-semialdehyde 2,1-aminomutase